MNITRSEKLQINDLTGYLCVSVVKIVVILMR